jgi:DoxX-like protein
MTYALWIIQVLLAALFAFGGFVKLTMPLEALEAATGGLPGLLLKFISVCELLGAVGLILPGLLRIKPGLTPLTAAGLTIIMIGATVDTQVVMGAPMVLLPLVVGLLTAFVAYGRWRLAPQTERPRTPAYQAAAR